MEITIPNELRVTVNSLDDYLNSKYQFRPNTESLRHEVMIDIERWYMLNKDFRKWEIDEDYRKWINEQIQQVKLSYYTSLVNQSGLDEKTQRNLILKFVNN